MTYQDDFTLSVALLEQLSTQGLGALPDLFPVLLNAAMQIERQKHLGAAPHERTVLGVSVALSEHEVHWRTFLQSLVARGLCGVRLVISDAHEGLKAARLAVFGGVPWQRCQFHLPPIKPQQNASAYVPKQEMKPQVAADIRAIFNAQDRAEANALLKRTAQKYEQTAPKLAAWLEENLPKGLTVLSFPEAHRRLLRTTNGVERVN